MLVAMASCPTSPSWWENQRGGPENSARKLEFALCQSLMVKRNVVCLVARRDGFQLLEA